jgi:hypothetical protein
MLWFALLMIGSLSACRAQAYTPQTDASIPAGEQRFSSLTIPEGVSVLLEGDSVLHVVGEVVISGRLIGDCTRLEIRAGGAVTVSGLISNACEGDERAADLIILVEGDLTLGAAPSPEPVLISSGSIELRSVRGEGLDSDALFSEPAALLPLQSFLKWYSAAQPAGKETFIFNRPLEPGSAGDLKIVSGDLNDNIEVDVFVNTNLRAGDGSAAPAMGAAGRCENSQTGDKGGDVLIVVPQGTLHLAAGVILRAGDGGKGGNCVATSGCPALAHSGTGGAGGDVLLYVQNAELHPESVAAPGDGGPGGDARALGDDADAPCGEGCAAEADGGEGGRGGRYDLRSSLDIRFDPIPAVHGSNGGPGGWAHAIAGDGAACPDCPGGVGGEGGLAVARGGQGGNFGYATDYLIRFAEGARQVGAGGDAHAFPGNGGEGASCCRPPAVGGFPRCARRRAHAGRAGRRRGRRRPAWRWRKRRFA